MLNAISKKFADIVFLIIIISINILFIIRIQTWLSTAPTQPLTHWYQVRCLFPQPFLVTRAAQLVGQVTLKANKK